MVKPMMKSTWRYYNGEMLATQTMSIYSPMAGPVPEGCVHCGMSHYARHLALFQGKCFRQIK